MLARVHAWSALSGVWSYSGRFHLLHRGGPANAISLLFLFGPDLGDNSPYPSLHLDHPLNDSPQKHCPPVSRAPRREPICQASSMPYSPLLPPTSEEGPRSCGPQLRQQALQAAHLVPLCRLQVKEVKFGGKKAGAHLTYAD